MAPARPKSDNAPAQIDRQNTDNDPIFRVRIRGRERHHLRTIRRSDVNYVDTIASKAAGNILDILPDRQSHTTAWFSQLSRSGKVSKLQAVPRKGQAGHYTNSLEMNHRV